MQTCRTTLLFAALSSLVSQAASAVCPGCVTLPEVVAEIKTTMPNKGTEDWVAPSQQALEDFQAATAEMLEGVCAGGLPGTLSGVYTREVFNDATNQRNYCILASSSADAPWGTVIVYSGAGGRNLSILAPHALHDGRTGDQGVYVFRGTGARAFVMTGAHRHANDAESPCQGSYSTADAAHNIGNCFQAATIAIKNYFAPAADHTAIQFHGMAGSSCAGVSAYLTHSVTVPPQANEKIDLLRAALAAAIPEDDAGEAPIFTVPGGTPECRLAGTTNVQGRLFNSVPAGSVCSVSSIGYSGAFIHIEQKAWLRKKAQYDKWVAAINSVDFASAVPPRSVSLAAPSAGPIGLATVVQIKWTSFGVEGDVELSLHANNDAKSKKATIASSAPNTGAFEWLVPGSVPTNGSFVVRVRSTAHRAVKAYSGPLTFFNPITIAYPGLGITLRTGSSVQVKWTAPGVGNVKLALCKGTAFYKTIANEIANDGHYLWTVPFGVDTPYEGYTVRVRSVDEISVKAFSDPFAVFPSAFLGLRVTEPEGGFVGLATTVTVRWTSFGVPGDVQISLHENNEAKQHRRNIAASTANTGSFAWDVGSISTDTSYVIRVRIVDDTAIKAYSEPITFFNPITLLHPNGGEVLHYGDDVQINWTAPGVGNVKLALCKGTAFYQNIAVETENDGQYLWTVPNSIDAGYEGYTVRVRSVDVPSVKDFSDAPIAILQ